jgi:hypothetical protein
MGSTMSLRLRRSKYETEMETSTETIDMVDLNGAGIALGIEHG